MCKIYITFFNKKKKEKIHLKTKTTKHFKNFTRSAEYGCHIFNHIFPDECMQYIMYISGAK